MIRIPLTLLVLLFALPPVRSETPPLDPGKDPKIATLLQEASKLAGGGQPAQAVEKCDQIIDAFKGYYKDSKKKIYCARTSAETLAYMGQAAIDKTEAIAISPLWADAYFVKGYALQDLHRVPEAKASLEAALALSPLYSHYLSELGNLYQSEKNWTKSKELFKQAEDVVPLAPEPTQAGELARARRGIAYCLTEEGDLDGAEKIYEECLKANPDDAKAKHELAYIKQLRAQTPR